MRESGVIFGLFVLGIFFVGNTQTQETPTTTEFAPQVSATCKEGFMNIKVLFNNPFNGAVHARDFRNPYCMAFGNNTNKLTMSLNLLAKQGNQDYCGVLTSNSNSERGEERSVQIAVRVHKTLELAEDKFYIITCGKPTFPKDDSSQVVLKFLDNDNYGLRELAYGREYQIRAELNQQATANESLAIYNGLKVRNCFAFNKKNFSYPLIDARGCSTDGILSRFIPSADGKSATSMVTSMFKFPEGAEVHLQCDIVLCTDKCPEDEKCGDTKSTFGGVKGRDESNVMLAATTVFVLDPAEITRSAAICDRSGFYPSWLLWLAIILGVLFLIMLLMNLFLCTAMSCSCARTEIIEKEPSIIEEYDPYRSWHGSQYGSRYSLHGNGMKHGYTSGGSTIHSTRTVDSDPYAVVHPGRRM